MDFLRQQLVIINDRLAGLSASQKMLTAALAVIVVMTLLYWGKGAANTEMVPVMPGALAGEDLANVTARLQSLGIDYETNAAGQILVPATRQEEAMMDISFSGAVRSQTVDQFAAMLAGSSPWDTEGKWTAQLQHYTEQRFSRIIARAPGIQEAEVSISQPDRLGIAPQPPTAHVDILTKPGNTISRRKMAEGAANVVASSIGIDRAAVGVNIDGQSQPVGDANGGGSGFDSNELLGQQRAAEEQYAEQVRNTFADIRGLRVHVRVQLDNETAHTVLNDVDGSRKVVLAERESMERMQSVDPPPAQQEPGVQSNVGMSVTQRAAGAAPAGTNSERTETDNVVDYARWTTTSTKQAGTPIPVSATIRVPRSHFATIWKQTNPGAGEAVGEAFELFLRSQLDEMRSVVRQQFQFEAENTVTATAYSDVQPAPDGITATGGPMLAAADTTGGGLKVFAAGHAKDVAVGVLALASLFMVGRMVKKSAPATPEPMLALDGDATPLSARTAANNGAVAAKVRAASASTLHGAEDVAGDVLEGGAVLMGQELDEAVLETSQMVDQVGGFVKDNPEMAAQLLSRWMSRE